MKKIMLATLFAAISPNLYALDNKVIYGADNRIDYYKMRPEIKKLADSVVSLWNLASVEYNPSTNRYKLKTVNFGERFNLCNDEPFRNQPIGAFCSGALIGDDIVITAGHCITDENKCSSTYFIFGYAVKNINMPDTAQTEFLPNDVYRCSKIIKTQVGPEPTPDNPQGIGLGPDYAIVKLDRKVYGRSPLKINTNQNIKKGERVFVIGHPVGLPVKYADGAYVRDPSPNGYFVANLDTYGGNSGSPVFNTKTKLIEGILVRGEEDFVSTPMGCTMSNVVPDDGGRGEDVTKISVLYQYLSGIIPQPITLQEKPIKTIKVNTDFIEEIDFSRTSNFDFK